MKKIKKQIIISQILKTLLKEKGISTKELARLAGVPSSTVATWLLEKSRPRNIESVSAVADVLNVSLQHLLFGEVERSVDLETIPAEKVLKGVFRLSLERLDLQESIKRKKLT